MAASSLAVFDGVFSNESCASLRAYSDSFLRTDQNTFFRRGPAQQGPSNTIERALDSFLNAIGDDAAIVEYWRRAKWAHVALHRDIDEQRANQGTYQHPRNGHVLYLDVGKHVVGPTSVFWADETTGASLMTTVPAVEGRVLRFNGSLLHAVPRPHDAWLLGDGPMNVDASGPHAYVHHAPDAAERRRDVILFNTWPDGPPAGIEPGTADPIERAIAVTATSVDTWVRQEPRLVAVTAAEEVAAGEEVVLHVDLMGDCVRRGRDEREVLLTAPAGVGAALGERFDAISVPLTLTTADGLAAPGLSSACQQAMQQTTRRWSRSRVSEMLKTLRSGSDGTSAILSEVREAASAISALSNDLEALPNDLLLEIGSALLDANDVPTARALLGLAVGPAASRMLIALGPPPAIPALYARRAQLLDSAKPPAQAFSSMLELGLLPAAAHASVRSECARRACVTRSWALQYPQMQAALAVDRLAERCGEVSVHLSRRGGGGSVEALRIQRNGAWTDQVPLRMFLGKPHAGVFVHEHPLESGGCASALEDYVVPDLAANDYARRVNASQGYPDGWPSRQPPLSVGLSVYHGANKGGLQLAPKGSALVLVVHSGAAEVSVYPLSPRDVLLRLYPEKVLADKWNGSASADGVFETPEAALHTLLAMGHSFPSVSPVAALRFPLLEEAHASRLTTTLQAGDVLYVPAGLPYSVQTTEATVLTSIYVVDGLNFEHARAHLAEQEPPAYERMEAIHRTKLAKHENDVPHAQWGPDEGLGSTPAEAVGGEHDEL